jgi:hypothetical protein
VRQGCSLNFHFFSIFVDDVIYYINDGNLITKNVFNKIGLLWNTSSDTFWYAPSIKGIKLQSPKNLNPYD